VLISIRLIAFKVNGGAFILNRELADVEAGE
jgi:hypothetical protein